MGSDLVMNKEPEMPLDLLGLDLEQMRTVFREWGESTFRADQVYSWLYEKAEFNPEAMTNLPLKLRDRLAASTSANPLTLVTKQVSDDEQTEKGLFELSDGALIESVLMHYERRHTVCVSTQAGCPVGCSFCATGQSGFVRNLSASEIVAQVLHFAQSVQQRNTRITNVVFMGMGEPFLNYDATWAAIRRLNDPVGFGLRARGMTISTVGVVPGIRRMSQEREQVGLAISLHAPNDALRDELVPLNRKYPLLVLMEACREYIAATRRRLTVEYALIENINDGLDHAQQLASLVAGMLVKVNLIPLNPTTGSSYRPSPSHQVRQFQEELQGRGVETTVRLRRGLEISAGCGQLRSRYGNTR
jgi:23S rRNA (adenine2503-C2)-methyltransferase